MVFSVTKNVMYVKETILIAIIVLSVISFSILTLMMGILRYNPEVFPGSRVWITCSVAGFIFAVAVSIYHLRMMFHRRKRRNDTESGIPAVNPAA